MQVLPSDNKKNSLKVDYGVYAPDISFTDSEDHNKPAKLEFVAVAWDKNGTAAGSTSQTMDLGMKPATYQATLERGIPAHLELEFKPGTYKLRLGVMDYGSGKIGTLEVPLSIPEYSTAGH